MTPEQRSKIQSLVGDLGGLRSRAPEEGKLKDWKDKAMREVEETFGKGSEQASRFRALKFFDFGKRPGGVPKDAPLREDERAQYLKGIEDARRLLSRFTDL